MQDAEYLSLTTHIILAKIILIPYQKKEKKEEINDL